MPDQPDGMAAALAHAEAKEHADNLLTPTEITLVGMLGKCADVYATEVVGDGPTREHDVNEFIAHIHDLQARVMMQAAARAYPDRFRLAGQTLEEHP